MILFFLTLYQLSPYANSLPIALDESTSFTDLERKDNATSEVYNKNYRSSIDILWTCLVTIFACTWICVHPNVAGYNSRWWDRLCARLNLFAWALVAPELILLMAFRQWCGARSIARTIGHSWSSVEGHFLQMGGFVFKVEGDQDVQYIDPFALCSDSRRPVELAAREKLKRLPITKEEILDKSKGDELAKGLVVLQTSWFVLQSLARAQQGLATTELEIMTLAYAALNGVLYTLWWNKPLDVQCPVVILVSRQELDSAALSLPDATQHDDPSEMSDDVGPERHSEQDVSTHMQLSRAPAPPSMPSETSADMLSESDGNISSTTASQPSPEELDVVRRQDEVTAQHLPTETINVTEASPSKKPRLQRVTAQFRHSTTKLATGLQKPLSLLASVILAS